MDGIAKRAMKLAQMLMLGVYVPFSAVISLNASGNILGLCQFDTLFGSEKIRVAEGAAALLFLSNHPEGNPRFNRQDESNLRALSALAPGLPVRVFVCGEDIDCVEIRDAGRNPPA